MEDSETTETQYSANIHNGVSMLSSLMRHQVKNYHHHLVYILSDYILIFCTHLFGDRKYVFFIVFNTGKLLLFCICLSCVDRMLYFLLCIQIFIFGPTHLPQLPQSSLLRCNLTDLFIVPPRLFSSYAFLCPATSFLCSREYLVSTSTKYCLLAHLWYHSFHP